MPQLTVGQLLINEALPPELRDYSRRLDKKAVKALFQEIAQRHPEKYRDIIKRLSDIGREVAYETGGMSFSVRHLRPAPEAEKLKERLRADIARIRKNVRDPEKRGQMIIDTVNKYQDALTEAVFEHAKRENNPLAQQVMSGSRGSKTNLRSLLAGDLLYEDNRGNVIPVPILNSYSDGLTMAEYWAGAYGARKGIVDVKNATRQAGALGKRLRQATHRLITTAIDVEDDVDEFDPKNPPLPYRNLRGMLVDVDDDGNEGALLAVDVAGYPRNTALTPRILDDLKKKGVKRIIIRTPLTSHARNGGIYSRDAGVRERGDIPPLGDYVGLAGADALNEPISQSQISSKHTGGIAGATTAVAGFPMINQLIQVPKHFPGGAAHAQKDGVVSQIKPAPQGGHYIYVGEVEHYVPADQKVLVKPGQMVEAGDAMSDGLPNPSELVKHKGIGEGRRAFVDQFRRAIQMAGLSAKRRNIELLARGLIDRVQMVEDYDDFLPDELVPYSLIEWRWQPRDTSREVSIASAKGKYLEVPVLHYTIGTPVRPSVIRTLKEAGIRRVVVNDEPPPFRPIMIRGQDLLQSDPDAFTRHLGEKLKKTTYESVVRGRTSNPRGTSFVPAMLDIENFGRRGPTRGWQPPPLKPEEKIAPPRPAKSLLDGLDDIPY